MGGDGGQVIDRATMVKTKGWGLTKGSGDRYAASLGEMANYVQMTFEDRGLGHMERHRTRMSQCWLSQEELRDPVVACRLGNLYNKEAMIGAFLNKTIPPGLSHVKKLGDLKNCVITWREAEAEDGKKRMVCPLSREDLDSGGSRAVVIWSTGAVVGLKSLKALKAKECPITGKPFDFDKDVIALAPDDEELAKLRERLPATAATKKRKADSSGSAPAAEAVPNVPAASSSDTQAPPNKSPSKSPDTDAESKNPAAESMRVGGKKVKGSEVYKKMFTNDREGLSGPRDAFGKPMYNRGSLVQ